MQDLLKRSSQRFPTHLALLDGPKKITYAELFHEIYNMRKKLRSLKTNSIGIQHVNDIRMVIVLFACLYENISCFLINTYLPPFFIKKNVPPQPIIGKDLSFQELFALKADTALLKDTFDPQKPFTYMFTTGTSQTPKLAAHSYDNFFKSALGANLNVPLQEKDRWLITLPLFHVGGLSILFRCFLEGATVVFPDKNLSLSENLHQKKITHASFVPTQLKRLLKEPLLSHNLKALIIGGAKTPQSLYRQAIKGFPIYLTYGLTEMSSQVFTTKNILWNEGHPYLGFPLKYRQVKLIDHELHVGGPTLFLGYFKNGKILRPKSSFFVTSDLFSFSKKHGFCPLGRKDRVFTSGGENIQPEEIEKALLEIPEIQMAFVLAVPHPEYEMRPYAFVQSTNFDEKQIKNRLQETLASYKIPDRILPYEELPKFYLKENEL